MVVVILVKMNGKVGYHSAWKSRIKADTCALKLNNYHKDASYIVEEREPLEQGLNRNEKELVKFKDSIGWIEVT